MHSTQINLKVLVLCYAVLAFPYVALALDLRAFSPRSQDSSHSHDTFARSDAVDASPISQIVVPVDLTPNVFVHPTTVTKNVAPEDQEVFYFRNHTMVGKKSSGFNITQFDIESGHPDRSYMTPAERLAAGDSLLSQIVTGIAIGAGLGALATAICIVTNVAGCGQAIAVNIRNFVATVNGVSGSSGAAGEAAGRVLEAVAGTAASTLPTKRDYTAYEEFGCFYVNGYDGTCTNEDVAGPMFETMAQDDGSDENTPIYSCYESTDSSDGTVFGYYSHCFGDNADCALQCGAGNPEVTQSPDDDTFSDS